MKKIFIIILFILFLPNISNSQPTEPPADPSCYTDYYSCSSWSSWSSWMTLYSEFDITGNCTWFAFYKTRHCINDPSVVEIWIGQFGIVPPAPGQDCNAALIYLYPNWPNTDPLDYDHAQKIKMKLYRQVALQEFESIPVQNRPICGQDQPIKYGMRFPGSCTMFCSYKNNSIPTSIEIILLEKACYDTYCCGKTYSLCWQPTPAPGQIVLTEYTNGATTGNCDPPTGNPPVGRCLPPPDEQYDFNGATECSNSCNYGNE